MSDIKIKILQLYKDLLLKKAETLSKAPIQSDNLNFNLSTVLSYIPQTLRSGGKHSVKEIGILPNASREIFGRVEQSPANGKKVYHHIIEDEDGKSTFHTLSLSPELNQRPLSAIHVNHYKNSPSWDGYPDVNLSSSDYHGFGLGQKIYEEAIKHHGKLKSSSSVSGAANKTWEKILSKPEFSGNLGQVGSKDDSHKAEYIGDQQKNLASNELEKANIKGMPKNPTGPLEQKEPPFMSRVSREALKRKQEAINTWTHGDYNYKEIHPHPKAPAGHKTWELKHRGTGQSHVIFAENPQEVANYINRQSPSFKYSPFNKSDDLEKGLKGDWQKEGYTFKHYIRNHLNSPYHRDDMDSHEIHAIDPKGEVVGKYTFHEYKEGASGGTHINQKIKPHLEVWSANTHPDHQRKGLATTAYQIIEQKTQKPVEIGVSQSKEAKALWSQPNRSFGKSEDSFEGSDIDQTIYIACDGDNIGASVERAAMKDDVNEIRKQSSLIQKGQDLIEKWAKDHEGEVYIYGGDDVSFMMPKKYITKLNELKDKYKEITGYTITIGVGETVSNAGHAMLWGKLNGKNQINEWSKRIQEELDQSNHGQTPEEKLKEEGLIKSTIEDYFWEDLNKSDRKIGDINPNNPDQVWGRMSNGVEAWKKNDNEARNHDNFIKNSISNFVNKQPASHQSNTKMIYNEIMNDPDRHFIPTQRNINDPKHTIRARHLRSLILGHDSVNIKHNSDGATTFSAHRHSKSRPEFTSHWTFSPNGVNYAETKGHDNFKENMVPTITPTSSDKGPTIRVGERVLVRRGARSVPGSNDDGSTAKSENDTEWVDISYIDARDGLRSGRSYTQDGEELQNFSKREGNNLPQGGLSFDSSKGENASTGNRYSEPKERLSKSKVPKTLDDIRQLLEEKKDDDYEDVIIPEHQVLFHSTWRYK